MGLELQRREERNNSRSVGGIKKIIPPQPRGVDRRKEPRPGETDWRVNPRSYDFIGATFDL